MTEPSPRSSPRSQRPYGAAQHRALAHDSAHAHDAPEEGHHPPIQHPLVTHAAPAMIQTQSDLSELLAHLRSAGSFAYDSEFIGELTYIPKLCLIQVASSQRVALIDPLAELDLRPFWELICDSSIEKIVHAGLQDVEPVFRILNRAPAHLFDTQIAAGFIGLAYPSALSKLVGEVLGAKLGKGLTFTHWDQRPLSAQQVRYAADDVRYLPALRAEMGQRLDELGHARGADQESQTLCEAARYGFDPEANYLKLRGAATLSPRNLAVLKELTIWRDAVGRKHNVPARSLVKDEVLLDLARNPVKTLDKLDRVRGLPRPVEAANGQEIVEATARGLAADLKNIASPPTVDPSPAQRFRADALWSAVQCLCAGRGIDPALVTSRQEIVQLCGINPLDPPADLSILHGWRGQTIGNDLLNWMRGKSHLQLHWSKQALLASLQSSSLT